MDKKKNKKETKFNYTEEFKTNKKDATEQELKEIFNKKYFKYILKKEKRFLGGCINE